MHDTKQFLRTLFDVAVQAAQPERVLPQFLPQPPAGRTLVLGAGKAAAAMAKVVDEHWQGELSGLVVTRYGQARDCGRIEVLEAAHPVPDAAGRNAAQQILGRCAGLTDKDLVLCLISGGGSALLSLPGEGISLEDKQELNRQLLACGASIAEINIVRKHVSAIKGGRLAAACYPARVLTLMISDVTGDDPQLIASGPTVPDPSTVADAKAVIARYQLDLPASVTSFLDSAAAQTPGPDDPRLAGNELLMVTTAQQSLQAAADYARQQGVAALILSDAVEGESREAGSDSAAIALKARHQGQPLAPPCVLLSGGETTVTIRGDGRGGPNTEFALGMAISLAGEAGISALAADTDGIDGNGDNAGCIIDEHTLARAREAGLDAAAYLENNDAWHFFQALGDLVITGPTHTNVNDFRAVYIAPAGSDEVL